MCKHTKNDIQKFDHGGQPRRSKKHTDLARAKFHPEYVKGQAIWFQEAKPSDFGPSLDTSAQLPRNTKQEFPRKNFEKRARAKYITNSIAVPLASIPSPLENSYKTTQRCSANLTEAQGKLSGLYCGQRWCLVCARIRTAKLIAGYMPALLAMQEKWFLTLTVPNCKSSDLEKTVKGMLKNASLINRALKERYKLKYSSLRKIECTYNAQRGDYHPHFHFIFDSELAAEMFLVLWLKKYPAADRKAQDLKRADDKACLELFKYFTKVVSKRQYKIKRNGVEFPASDYKIYIKPLDVMFCALRGTRTFQPCGVIKAVSEDVEPEQAELTYRDMTAAWTWLNNDWCDKETGEMLTGYEPSDNIESIAQNIVLAPDQLGNLSDLVPTAEAEITSNYEPKPVPLVPVCTSANRVPPALAGPKKKPVYTQTTILQFLPPPTRL
jgi:hypothetical protein